MKEDVQGGIFFRSNPIHFKIEAVSNYPFASFSIFIPAKRAINNCFEKRYKINVI
jgi:hypothetical protein